MTLILDHWMHWREEAMSDMIEHVLNILQLISNLLVSLLIRIIATIFLHDRIQQQGHNKFVDFLIEGLVQIYVQHLKLRIMLVDDNPKD